MPMNEMDELEKIMSADRNAFRDSIVVSWTDECRRLREPCIRFTLGKNRYHMLSWEISQKNLEPFMASEECPENLRTFLTEEMPLILASLTALKAGRIS